LGIARRRSEGKGFRRARFAFLSLRRSRRANATDDDRATIERLTAERTQIEAEIRVLSARLGLGTDPLRDTTAPTSALANDAQTTINAPQTAGATPTIPKTITPGVFVHLFSWSASSR
jgi:hypothetical protein